MKHVEEEIGAEAAYEVGDLKAAGEGYAKAVDISRRDWVKSRAGLRLIEVAGKTNNFGLSVTAFLAMVQRDPKLAAAHRSHHALSGQRVGADGRCPGG